MTRAVASRKRGTMRGPPGPRGRRACTPAAEGGGRAEFYRKRRWRGFLHVREDLTLYDEFRLHNAGQCIDPNREPMRPERVCNRDASGRQLARPRTRSRPAQGCSRRGKKSRRAPGVGGARTKMKPSADPGQRAGRWRERAWKKGLSTASREQHGLRERARLAPAGARRTRESVECGRKMHLIPR